MTEQADFRALLAEDRCWDAGVQAAFEATGEPRVDAILQNREELIRLCEQLTVLQIRSFLEIGVWTGRLVSTLHRIFHFDLVAAVDHGYAQTLGLPLHLPADAHFLAADSDSAAYMEWRAGLPPFDLVFIDANHSYRAVRRDFEINRALPHRFLAFHDIAGTGRATAGVRRLWSELGGRKIEIVAPHAELGLDHSTMGIGIWSER